MKTSTKILNVMSGIFFVLSGVLILTNKVATLLSITMIIAILILLSGIFGIIFYFTEAKKYYGASEILVTSIFDVICGIIMLTNIGISSAFFLTLLSIFIMIKGVSTLAFSFDVKHMGFKYWYVATILGIIGVIIGGFGIFNINVAAAIVTFIVGIGFILTGFIYFLVVFEANKIDKYLENNKDFYI